MIKNIAITLLFLLPNILQGQEIDTLDKLQYRKIIRTEFSGITNSNISSDLGTFANLNIADSEVTFSPSYFLGDNTILKLNFKGGITEGISTLFNEGDFNPKYSLGLNFNFITKRPKLSFEDKSNQEYYSKKKKLNEQFSKDSLNVIMQIDSIRLDNELQKVEKLIVENNYKLLQDKKKRELDFYSKSLKDKRSKLLDKINVNKAKRIKEKDILKQDSISIEIFQLENQLSNLKLKDFELDTLSIKYKLDSLNIKKEHLKSKINSLPGKFTQLLRLKASEVKQIKDLTYGKNAVEIKLLERTIEWISIGTSVNSSTFSLFDNTLPFEEQIRKDTFVNFELDFSWNRYSFSSKKNKSNFHSVGLSFQQENNFGELSKTIIEEKSEFGVNPGDRFTSDKKTVYVGDFMDNLNTFRIYYNHYHFFGKNNDMAYHVYSEIKWKEEFERSENIGVGLLFRYKKDGDTKSNVNAELFYTVNDILNNNESDVNFFKRGSIGLQFSFPLTIKSKEYVKKDTKSKN